MSAQILLREGSEPGAAAVHARAQSLSGGGACRIYFHDRAWLLEFDTACGGRTDPAFAQRAGLADAKPLVFQTLAAAVSYAQRHGLHYRLLPPRWRRRPSVRRSHIRTWSGRPAQSAELTAGRRS